MARRWIAKLTSPNGMTRSTEVTRILTAVNNANDLLNFDTNYIQKESNERTEISFKFKQAKH